MKTLFTSVVLILLSLIGKSQPIASESLMDEEGMLQFSDETIRLLADPDYRDSIYPDQYTIYQVPGLLEEGKVLFALWTLMNVYPGDQEKTRTVARMLAQKGIQSTYYIKAYYTYVFADPQIFHFEKGKAGYMDDPVLLETKLENCKSLMAYTEAYLRVNHPGE